LNAGSVFSVYLPRLDGTARPTETAASADQPQGGLEHILVAEDEDAVRNFVRRVLAGAGYQVMAAASGEEAVHVADSMGRLDLLVTDVVMPGMNGVQLAAHLTKTRPDLPILYASGYSDEGIPKGAGQGRPDLVPRQAIHGGGPADADPRGAGRHSPGRFSLGSFARKSRGA